MDEPFTNQSEAGAGGAAPGDTAVGAAENDHAPEPLDHSGSTEIPIGKPVGEESFAELKRRAAIADAEEQTPGQQDNN